MTRALLYRSDFLGQTKRELVRVALDDDALCWLSSAALGRTASGESLQLAGEEEHRKLPMRRVAGLVASRVVDALHEAGIELPSAEEITPQVFPVKMYGNQDDPPRQAPHRDQSESGHPRLTCVYYPLVENHEGGELVLYSADGTETAKYLPANDLLLVIGGDTVHSVEPLISGRRYTVVTNLYW